MFKNKSLIELMDTPLPSLTAQKRLLFRPDLRDVERVYDKINHKIFNNKLYRPDINLGTCRNYWGMCIGEAEQHDDGSFCTIKLSDKWYSVQWMVAVLAHEMAHQYQYEIDGVKRIKLGKDPIMSHGPSFFMFRDIFSTYGIPLRRSHSKSDWFKYQNLFKC